MNQQLLVAITSVDCDQFIKPIAIYNLRDEKGLKTLKDLGINGDIDDVMNQEKFSKAT